MTADLLTGMVVPIELFLSVLSRLLSARGVEEHAEPRTCEEVEQLQLAAARVLESNLL